MSDDDDCIKYCPLCGSSDLKVLKSQNFRCNACMNSFVAKQNGDPDC